MSSTGVRDGSRRPWCSGSWGNIPPTLFKGLLHIWWEVHRPWREASNTNTKRSLPHGSESTRHRRSDTCPSSKASRATCSPVPRESSGAALIAGRCCPEQVRESQDPAPPAWPPIWSWGPPYHCRQGAGFQTP